MSLNYNMHKDIGLFVFSLRVILAWKTWFARDLRLGGQRYNYGLVREMDRNGI
jgi:hypothetical protein